MSELSLMSVRQFSEKHPVFSAPSMRNIIFKSDQKGNQYAGLKASGAILRVGRKVMINEGKFLSWMQEAGSQ